MKPLALLAFGLLLAGRAPAQTVPFDPTAPQRGGTLNQTAVPPANPGLNQSTVQGPNSVQRTPTSYDAQPSRPLPDGAAPVAGTPEMSPTAVPAPRERPLSPSNTRRRSTDVVPSRGVPSSTTGQPR